MRCSSISKSLYFITFPASFCSNIFSEYTEISMNYRVSSLSWSRISDLLNGLVLSFIIFRFYCTVASQPWCVSAGSGMCSYHFFFFSWRYNPVWVLASSMIS
jgi:hypothetical protein